MTVHCITGSAWQNDSARAATEQKLKTRAIRGQPRPRLCFRACSTASDSVPQLLSSTGSLSHAVSAWSCTVRKTREFSESAARPLVWARACRGKRTTGTRHKVARISCYDVRQCARIARPTLDGRFQSQAASSRSGTRAASVHYTNCALHDGCRCDDTCSHDDPNKQIQKTRAIRGQRRP
jgi:hypothetical protein